MRLANSLVAIGEMLLMSTTILPGVSPSATPPGPYRAASTFGVSGTMVMMTSAARATSLAPAQGIAPGSSSACGGALRLSMNSVWPPASRWPAMGRPMMPRPMNPMLLIVVSLSSGSVGCSARGLPRGLIGMQPVQPGRCRGARLVFAADPAGVAEFVDAAEQEEVVDLAGSGFVAAGIVGELDVADAAKLRLDGAGEIALHHLRMVDIVLQLQVVGTHGCDDLQRRAGAIHEEPRHVAAVDRLQQQPDAGGFELGRGIAQVVDQRGAGRVRGDTGGQNTGEAVDARTAKRDGVVDGARHPGAELGDPPRMAADAALAARPVAGGQVVQHQGQSVGSQQVGELVVLEVIGE